MQKLILYLPADDLSTASWAFYSASGGVEKSVLHGSRDELRADAADKEVIVIPPAQDVLLTQVQLPKLNRHRLMQALPYALEEQLLTDIGALHFAVGEYQPDGTLPVAIVTRQKMENWLTELKELNIFPTSILPAIMAVPAFEASWNIFVLDNHAIARTNAFHGFACDLQNLPDYIELELAGTAQKPQTVYLQNYTETRQELTSPALNIIEKMLPAKNFIDDIALKLKAPFINLCQSSYQPRHKPSENKKYWRLAGYTLAAWLGILFLSNFVSYLILHHQSAKLDASINGIYKIYFPHATAVVSPKERLADKLNSLQNQGNKNHLLLWLAYLGKDLPEAHNVHLLQLDYRNGLLALDLSAKGFDGIDRLAKALTQDGVAVKQQNVASVGTDVKGTLIITENKS
jgi:general secretion pathway protein L